MILSQRNREFRATRADIQSAYRLLLGRKPDATGWQHFSALVKSGVPVRRIVSEIIESDEYQRRSAPDAQLVQLAGRSMYAQASDLTVGNEIIRYRNYEPWLTRTLSGLLRPGDTFVDIGANIGWFTMLAASKVGGNGKVVAVEPNPANVQLILASLLENGFRNVRVLPYAASDDESVVAVSFAGSNGVIQAAGNARDGAVYAQCVRLDDVLASLPRIDVVKIDVEGHEPQAVNGFRQLLSRHRPILFSEFHPKMMVELHANAPEAYLKELFDLYDNVSAVLRDDTIKPCRSPGEVMDVWRKANEKLGLGDQLHLDLMASNDQAECFVRAKN